jgi:hypothetical protein
MPDDRRLPSPWTPPAGAAIFWPFGAVQDYWVDATQRAILMLDALRQRGDTQIARSQSVAPNVLSFQVELLVDGRQLARPVNYGLVRVIPPHGTVVDPAKRPFIVFDPRAGHGPGIGGMKQESEIGVALAAGHPCYFVGFLPEAMPGQTIEDVCAAEAHFVQAVIALHPDAESHPCLIGNCQAGWQIMMMASLHPELPGPILLAGAPLSYWAGVRGKNPMRYTGGLLGGSWLTAMTGDIGHGTFDGAHLIANFEGLNPANTHWKKLYNLYSKVDTEAPRFLDFESWWGNPVTLNATEMQFIVDELFVGNKLDDIFASASGFTEIRVKLNDSVKAGQTVAVQRNSFGDIIRTYTAGSDGRVAIIGTDAIRERGVDVVSILTNTPECAKGCAYAGDEP